MNTLDQVVTAWNQLNSGEQLVHWANYLNDLDCGQAGLHRFSQILMPLWIKGEVPHQAANLEIQIASHSIQNVDIDAYGAPPF